MDATNDPWAVLADDRASAQAVEQAITEVTLRVLEPRGPRADAPAVVPRLVEQLATSTRGRTALISLLSRLALGERPWPGPANSPEHRAVRGALLAEASRLLPLVEGDDARTRHLLAHLLAWLGPSPAIDAALSSRLKVEKYEAVRASLLLAVAVRSRGGVAPGTASLLRAHLAPNTPIRVTTAAAVGLCLLDPEARSEPTVRGALLAAIDCADLSATELAWNRGDLRGLALQHGPAELGHPPH